MPLPKYVQDAFDSKNLFAETPPMESGIAETPPMESDITETPPMESGIAEDTVPLGSQSPFPRGSIPKTESSLPDYVLKEMGKREQPEEWGTDWMRENPTLAGLYGAGKGLLEQAVVPTIETIGMIGGSAGSPIVGTALGYGMARQLSDYLVDSYKRLGGEDIENKTVGEEMLQSAADVGTVLVMGKAMDMGVKAAPYIEDYLFKELPKRLYARAIKTPMSKKWIQTLPNEIVSKQTAAIEEGLRSRIPPSKYGLSKIKNLEKEVSGYIDDITKILSEDPSKVINREDILKEGLKKAYAKAATSSDPKGAKGIVDAIADRFRAHPGSLTPAKANQIKRQLYKEVKYGASEPGAIKAQMDIVGKKGVAREIMLNLEKTYPALAELNATDAARISLTEAIEKSYAREAQKSMVPLGAKILLRPKTWPLSLWESTIGHPQIKTRLAFALHKANPVKYPAKPSKYTPPVTPKAVSLTTKPPESLIGLKGKALPEGTYTSSQLNRMLKSKDVIKVDTALESIIEKRMADHLERQKHVTTVNKMLGILKNEKGAVGRDIGKKKLIKPEVKLTTKSVVKPVVKPKIKLAKLLEKEDLGYKNFLEKMIKNAPNKIIKAELESVREFIHPNSIDKVTKAAIKHSGGKIAKGKNHAEIYKALELKGIPFKNTEDIGFVTNKNKFMTRDQAEILYKSYSADEFFNPAIKNMINEKAVETILKKGSVKPVAKPTAKPKEPFAKPEVKPKEKILYHTSHKLLKSGKPVKDAYYGNKDWAKMHIRGRTEETHNFGGYTYKVKVPSSAKILDLRSGSKESRELMAKFNHQEYSSNPEFAKDLLAGDKIALDVFYDDWAESANKILKLAKSKGYDGIKFNDEYFLSKGLVKEIHEVGQRTLKPIAKSVAEPKIKISIKEELKKLKADLKEFKEFGDDLEYIEDLSKEIKKLEALEKRSKK